MMPRIDTTDPQQRWEYACPTRHRHRDWRVIDGHFQCRSCGETFEELIDMTTKEHVHRDEFEFIGSEGLKAEFEPV